MPTVSDQITFEHPLNESSRTLLRLSHLFAQFKYHQILDTEWNSRAAVSSLIDISTILSRSDIKKELIKQLENCNNYLTSLSRKPGVDKTLLENILNELSTQRHEVLGIDGQLAQSLRNNVFINSIVQRNTIPGGTFVFDLPEYHHWINQVFSIRSSHLEDWYSELKPIDKTIELLLNIIRNSSIEEDKVAEKGFFQLSLNDHPNTLILKVVFNKDENLFAEISGGKHRFTIRFLQSNFEELTPQTKKDISFKLTICSI